MMRTFIALAVLATMAISPALANQTVEADNGEVYEISRISPTGLGGAEVIVYAPSEPAGMRIIFDCHEHMRIDAPVRSLVPEYIPPRSVASSIARVACSGIEVATKKMNKDICEKTGRCWQ